MIIGFAGANLPEGKVRFEDETLHALAQKDKPKKVTPFYAEFMGRRRKTQSFRFGI